LRAEPAWFTLSLAQRMTGEPVEVLEELENAGLIESLNDNEDHAAGQEICYAMHRIIGEHIHKKLSTERIDALNHIAADYYLERLQELEALYQGDQATSYSSMYRYENPEWRYYIENWLFYFTQINFDGEASLSFLQAWFDGFWWWSCFTDEGFDFCDQLLSEWSHKLGHAASGQMQDASADKQINSVRQRLEWFQQFKHAYPKETESRDSKSWVEVTKALSAIRHAARLDVELSQLTNPKARHVRAITDIFLAEAERFGRKNYSAAERHYREALMLFREAEEDWNIAWMLYHLGDMFRSIGQCEKTLDLCHQSLEIGQAEEDFEILALAYRSLGDCALAQQQTDQALNCYQSAIDNAYRFQTEPTGPDPYTIRFYISMTQSIAGQLLAASVKYPETAQKIVQGLHQNCHDHYPDVAITGNEEALFKSDAIQLAQKIFPSPLPLHNADFGLV